MIPFRIDEIDSLKDVKVITPFYATDNRGSFEKIYVDELLKNNNIKFSISEIFVSASKKNVIRGLHFQYNEPQTKLVTVLNGACMDVVVDLRYNSTTFLKYKFFELNDSNHNIIYIPKGFAHGFLSLSDEMKMMYICDGAYDKDSDTGILYNDKTLGIKWPIDDINNTIHSERDLKLMTFQEFDKLNIFRDF